MDSGTYFLLTLRLKHKHSVCYSETICLLFLGMNKMTKPSLSLSVSIPTHHVVSPSFGSAQQDLTVSAPVSGVSLSPFRARVSGSVGCLESCAGLTLSLTSEGLPARAADVAGDGGFLFEDVLPGQYDVAVSKVSGAGFVV